MNTPSNKFRRLASAVGLLVLAGPLAPAQTAPATDRERMLAILNLPTPPPSRPAGTPENHDESKAGDLSNLPNPLKLKNGQMVTDADTWWKVRRPEIFADTMTEIYGKIPANTPKIKWEVASTANDGKVKTKTVVGWIDNSSYPAVAPTIMLTIFTPANAGGPVPMIVEAGFGVGGPIPTREEMVLINNRLKAVIESADPSTKATFADNAAYNPLPLPPEPQPSPAAQQVLDKGWGYAVFNTGSVQPDNSAGLTQGIIGLMNKGQPRSRPDEWGVLAAWAWGLSKAVDYLETDKDVDAKQLGIEGFSRWGKTAVLAAAIEPRWALVWAGDSGEGGTKINRRDFGETVDDVAQNFPYWMAGNFQKYAGHHWDKLPVDAHEIVALVAPRPVFITGGTTDQHADSKGMFLAEVGAGPVYRLLGKQNLGATEMPAADVALISGDLGYRMHTGPHTQTPDWPAFLEFAGKYFHAPSRKIRRPV